MGNIYVGQSNLQISLAVGETVVGTVYIKYEKPTGETGQWTGTVIGSGSDTTVNYYVNSITDIDVAGIWYMWVKATYPTGKIAYTTPARVHVYDEGEPKQ